MNVATTRRIAKQWISCILLLSLFTVAVSNYIAVELHMKSLDSSLLEEVNNGEETESDTEVESTTEDLFHELHSLSYYPVSAIVSTLSETNYSDQLSSFYQNIITPPPRL